MIEKREGFWHSVIHVWSEFDPQSMDIPDLLFEADEGSAYPGRVLVDFVPKEELNAHPEWSSGAQEFFASGHLDDDED